MENWGSKSNNTITSNIGDEGICWDRKDNCGKHEIKNSEKGWRELWAVIRSTEKGVTCFLARVRTYIRLSEHVLWLYFSHNLHSEGRNWQDGDAIIFKVMILEKCHWNPHLSSVWHQKGKSKPDQDIRGEEIRLKKMEVMARGKMTQREGEMGR